MVNNKYVAGFFDADGSIMLKWWKQSDHYRFTLQIEFSQRSDRDSVLSEVQNKYPGGVRRGKTDYSYLTYTGKAALSVAEHIHKHSVIKGDYIRYIIDLYRYQRESYTKEGKKILEGSRKQIRKQENTRVYNFPSRQWLAGYVDGDGSLFIRWDKVRNRGQCFFCIDTAPWDKEGVNLIHKVYKGNLKHKDNVSSYKKYIGPQHIESILTPLAKHCIVKQRQAQMMIEVLRKGKITYQDYETMRSLNLGIKVESTRND